MAVGQKTLSRWLLAAVAAILVAAPLASPPRAAAGEFTIDACQADAGNFASTAFENFATRGMRWRRACNPLGPGLRGLVTANVVSTGKVAHGAQSAFVLEAPPGTAFSRLRWSGHAQRRDCRYALQPAPALVIATAETGRGADGARAQARRSQGPQVEARSRLFPALPRLRRAAIPDAWL